MGGRWRDRRCAGAWQGHLAVVHHEAPHFFWTHPSTLFPPTGAPRASGKVRSGQEGNERSGQEGNEKLT